MGTYVIHRLAYSMISVLLLSIFAFSLVRFAPGNPVAAMLGIGANPERIEALKHQLGLDQPVLPAYFAWLKRSAAGDLGMSFTQNKPVTTLLARKFPVTLTIATLALIIALILGFLAGIYSAIHESSWIGTLIMLCATVGLSIPSFWLGLMLIYVFAVMLRWFPVGGYVPLTVNFVEGLRRVFLPCFAIGLIQAALTARMVRSSMLETLRKDYTRTARAKGLKEHVVIYKHCLRNALIPVITTVGMIYGVLLGGAIVIETVFTIPGFGRLVVNAVHARDYPVLQGVILFSAAVYISINLATDLMYSIIDPRIRYD